MTKRNKKLNELIIIIVIAVAVIAFIAIGVGVYKNMTDTVYSGDGIYYSQQEEGKYLQFNKDNTFSYSVRVDETTEEITKGTWTNDSNIITLTYTESGNSYTYVKTGDDYLYREDKVFRGKTSDEKLLNNRFVLEEDGEVVEEMWFLNDGTVDYQITGDSKIKHGTYTRVDDILIVRYDSSPNVAHRFLVLDNGITKDIFYSKPISEAAR